MYPPMGCSDSNGWSTEKSCPVYILGLAPAFISTLPHDGAKGIKEGYSYTTNSDNSVYKVMAMNTVEADIIKYNHPFKSCDIRYGDGTAFPDGAGTADVNLYGWCSTYGVNDTSPGPAPTNCFSINDNNGAGDAGTGRFDKSYGLWGGFAPGTGSSTMAAVWPTAQTICK